MFAKMAENIIVKNIISAPKDPAARRRAMVKIKKEAELAERLKFCASFLEMWNFWREFYFHLPPYTPKTSNQITAIENAIAFCKERDLDVDMMIGCVHRSYRKRTLKPSFMIMYGENALEIYDGHYDLVLGDIDREEAMASSLRGRE
jgi:hypothetical protein